MGPNGEPERDDYGLPPVDVAIPDDARELDRDVLAYRRELRQRRWRRRWHHLTSVPTRYGVAAPFVACALLIALLSATIMTLVGTHPARRDPAAGGPPTSNPARGPGAAGGPLPVGRITAYRPHGGGTDLRDLRELRGVLIALVPATCRCTGTLTDLAARSRRHGAALYLVTADPPDQDVRALARAGMSGTRPVDREPRHAEAAGTGSYDVVAAQDSGGTLFAAYRPTGLTVVLVRADRLVGAVERDPPRHVLGDRRGRPRHPA